MALVQWNGNGYGEVPVARCSGQGKSGRSVLNSFDLMLNSTIHPILCTLTLSAESSLPSAWNVLL